MINQAYKYDLETNARQDYYLAQCLGASRYWFNQGLALVKERLNEKKNDPKVSVPWSFMGLCSELTAADRTRLSPWQKDLPSGAYLAGFEALGNALQNYSKTKNATKHFSFPSYKIKGRCSESVIFQASNVRIVDSRHLLFHKNLGPIKTHESMRKLMRLLARDDKARVLKATITRTSRGYAVSLLVERGEKQRRPRKPNSVVGVDLGLAKLATLSTGEEVDNSRPLEQALTKIRNLNRKLDRQRRANNPGNYNTDGTVKKGSRNWAVSKREEKTKLALCKTHARVANLRREQAHLFTTTLTREHGVIGMESLAVAQMLKSKNLSRQISDAGWGMILSQLKYKAEWSGGKIVAADQYYPSSKACSACGVKRTNLLLNDRVFTCDCGHEMNRDLNAARNIARVAWKQSRDDGLNETYVARAKRFTLIARGGTIPLASNGEIVPESREELRVVNSSSENGNALVSN